MRRHACWKWTQFCCWHFMYVCVVDGFEIFYRFSANKSFIVDGFFKKKWWHIKAIVAIVSMHLSNKQLSRVEHTVYFDIDTNRLCTAIQNTNKDKNRKQVTNRATKRMRNPNMVPSIAIPHNIDDHKLCPMNNRWWLHLNPFLTTTLSCLCFSFVYHCHLLRQ